MHILCSRTYSGIDGEFVATIGTRKPSSSVSYLCMAGLWQPSSLYLPVLGPSLPEPSPPEQSLPEQSLPEQLGLGLVTVPKVTVPEVTVPEVTWH